MQNKKKTLLLALLCLGIALPMLSGCRVTGPAYKMSSWQFFNPFTSKSKAKEKDYDDFALAQQFSEPSNLPKQDVMAPREGYSNNPRETNRVAAAGSNRTANTNPSDRLTDLHNAGLERNSNPAVSPGIVASTQPIATDAAFSQSGSAGMPANYGTTTPIESGFGGTNMNQMASQQPQNGTPGFNPYVPPAQPPMSQTPGFPTYSGDPNAGMFAAAAPVNQPQAVPGTPFDQSGFGQPGMGQPGQQYATPAQPNMMVQNPNQPQASAMGTGDPLYGGFANPAMPASTTSPQMVASTQGSGYVGQDFGAGNPGFSNPAAGVPAQGTMQQGTVPNNTAMPNGQWADPGFGTNGYNNPAVQPSPQATPATQNVTNQPFPVQQPANTGYQNGFNYFGPTTGDAYRPGAGQ